MEKSGRPDSTTVPTPAMLGRDYQSHLSLFEGKDSLGAQFRNGVKLVNTDKLAELVASALGTACEELHWVATGGSHFVFLLAMEDGREVIARVNRPDSHCGGPPLTDIEVRQSILAEVGMLQYLAENTSIPVPKVLGYNIVRDCGVGSGYMLQGRIIGQAVDLRKLDGDARKRFAEQMAKHFAELLQQRFPSIGSLYRQESTGEVVVGPMDQSVVGRSNLPQDACGPFTSTIAWLRDHAAAHVASLRSSSLKVESDAHNAIPPRACADAQLATWYEDVFGILDSLQLLRDRDNGPFALTHVDLSHGNVLVAYDDPSRVVAILDWEGARIVPLWLAVQPPDGLSVTISTITLEEEDELLEYALGIVMKAVPEANQALYFDGCLRYLRYILCYRYVFDVPGFYQKLRQSMLEIWPSGDPGLQSLRTVLLSISRTQSSQQPPDELPFIVVETDRLLWGFIGRSGRELRSEEEGVVLGRT